MYRQISVPRVVLDDILFENGRHRTLETSVLADVWYGPPEPRNGCRPQAHPSSSLLVSVVQSSWTCYLILCCGASRLVALGRFLEWVLDDASFSGWVTKGPSAERWDLSAMQRSLHAALTVHQAKYHNTYAVTLQCVVGSKHPSVPITSLSWLSERSCRPSRGAVGFAPESPPPQSASA